MGYTFFVLYVQKMVNFVVLCKIIDTFVTEI